ncbi:hypothetical protein HYH02_008607 [Chlamydomonas schloesseri]|uniref:Uncharacterized protein n=1 Tax=Chlamydomonas schloesseri TaxID=2026947 RepID=A0A835WCX0_9CHLO|nr:hypothetical protein HYH02_008607 [Chlamydomonas schloesseri]|eukprot:KAG2445139.1 hypothetical protein HYH02_008607 [Chlamydomonas schloesseri]
MQHDGVSTGTNSRLVSGYKFGRKFYSAAVAYPAESDTTYYRMRDLSCESSRRGLASAEDAADAVATADTGGVGVGAEGALVAAGGGSSRRSLQGKAPSFAGTTTMAFMVSGSGVGGAAVCRARIAVGGCRAGGPMAGVECSTPVKKTEEQVRVFEGGLESWPSAYGKLEKVFCDVTAGELCIFGRVDLAIKDTDPFIFATLCSIDMVNYPTFAGSLANFLCKQASGNKAAQGMTSDPMPVPEGYVPAGGFYAVIDPSEDDGAAFDNFKSIQDYGFTPTSNACPSNAIFSIRCFEGRS